jgi:putative heme-binding domain-containing protein
VGIAMPEAWASAYERLAASGSGAVRERAEEVAVLLGDRRILPRMREVLTDAGADIDRRKRALEILVRGRDEGAAPAFQAALAEPALRGPAIRALASLDDPATPAAILAQYDRLGDGEKRDAIGTLSARPKFAVALLDAVDSRKVPRTDLHAHDVRQLLRFRDSAVEKRVREVWGEVRETSAEKQAEAARWKSTLGAKDLAAADPGNGRRIFAKTCGTCHVLFGEGTQVGPDITGSNRADLDYVLENVLDPSATLAKEYRMTVVLTADGRVVSGLLLDETESAITLRTLNDTVLVAKSEITSRELSNQSMMPEGLLATLSPAEVRDLIAYLASPTQVALRGPRSPIDPETGRVPGAIEGEGMKVVMRSAGSANGQKMAPFTMDRWSGADQLWWTGAAPGARLELELPVAEAGKYDLELVLTRARDYGIIQLSLDGEKLGGPIDLYNPEVITTGVLTFPARDLPAGSHKLLVEIAGANPRADKAYMFGLDYVRLARSAAAGS